MIGGDVDPDRLVSIELLYARPFDESTVKGAAKVEYAADVFHRRSLKFIQGYGSDSSILSDPFKCNTMLNNGYNGSLIDSRVWAHGKNQIISGDVDLEGKFKLSLPLGGHFSLKTPHDRDCIEGSKIAFLCAGRLFTCCYRACWSYRRGMDDRSQRQAGRNHKHHIVLAGSGVSEA